MYANDLDDRQKKLLELLADGLAAGTVKDELHPIGGNDRYALAIHGIDDVNIQNFWCENATEADFRQFEEYGLMQERDPGHFFLRRQRIRNFVGSGFSDLPTSAPIQVNQHVYDNQGNVTVAVMSNVIQTVTNIAHGSPDERERLEKALATLSELLANAPAEEQETAEAVALHAQDIVQQLERERPNNNYLTMARDAILASAKKLGAYIPDLLSAAADFTTIAMAIAGIR